MECCTAPGAGGILSYSGPATDGGDCVSGHPIPRRLLDVWSYDDVNQGNIHDASWKTGVVARTHILETKPLASKPFVQVPRLDLSAAFAAKPLDDQESPSSDGGSIYFSARSESSLSGRADALPTVGADAFMTARSELSLTDRDEAVFTPRRNSFDHQPVVASVIDSSRAADNHHNSVFAPTADGSIRQLSAARIVALDTFGVVCGYSGSGVSCQAIDGDLEQSHTCTPLSSVASLPPFSDDGDSYSDAGDSDMGGDGGTAEVALRAAPEITSDFRGKRFDDPTAAEFVVGFMRTVDDDHSSVPAIVASVAEVSAPAVNVLDTVSHGSGSSDIEAPDQASEKILGQTQASLITSMSLSVAITTSLSDSDDTDIDDDTTEATVRSAPVIKSGKYPIANFGKARLMMRKLAVEWEQSTIFAPRQPGGTDRPKVSREGFVSQRVEHLNALTAAKI